MSHPRQLCDKIGRAASKLRAAETRYDWWEVIRQERMIAFYERLAVSRF